MQTEIEQGEKSNNEKKVKKKIGPKRLGVRMGSYRTIIVVFFFFSNAVFKIVGLPWQNQFIKPDSVHFYSSPI